jgi:hypothetical protein
LCERFAPQDGFSQLFALRSRLSSIDARSGS